MDTDTVNSIYIFFYKHHEASKREKEGGLCIWECFNLTVLKIKMSIDSESRIGSCGTESMCFTAGRGWNGKTDLSGSQQTFSRGVSHIDAPTISSRGGRSGHATGFSLPANFTNLFTDRYSSDRGATHKSGSGRKGGRVRRTTPVQSARIANVGSRVRSDGVENLFRSAGGQGCRKYNMREHLLGDSLDLERSVAPLRGGFQRAKRETRDTAKRERERSRSALAAESGGKMLPRRAIRIYEKKKRRGFRGRVILYFTSSDSSEPESEFWNPSGNEMACNLGTYVCRM